MKCKTTPPSPQFSLTKKVLMDIKLKFKIEIQGALFMRIKTASVFMLVLAILVFPVTAYCQWVWTSQRVHEALKEKNPGYNGKGQFKIQDGQVGMAVLSGTGITDLSPLKMMYVQVLDLRGLPITDLSSLEGLSLTQLYIEDTDVEDLSPLKGMPLVKLYLNNAKVKDIKPLHGMPLEALNLLGTGVDDLTPLRGMPLKYLWLNQTPVSDISALSDCPLVSLTLHKARVKDLSPLANSSLKRLHIGETPVTDLTPLKGLTLTRLIFTPGRIVKGIEIVRNMKSIREIGPSFENRMAPSRFWSLYSKGKFN